MTWYQKLEAVLAELLPLADAVVSIVDPAIAGAADKLTAELQSAIASLKKAQSMAATEEAFENARVKPLW